MSPSENLALPRATDFPSPKLLNKLGVPLVRLFVVLCVFDFRLPDNGLGGKLARVSPRGG